MNTAFHDALNLAWKIHQVEAGFAARSLLQSYESERRPAAESLLDFDAKYAKLFSQQKQQPSAEEMNSALAKHEENEEDESEFLQVFKSAREFTCGYGVVYYPNVLNWGADHPAQSPLFSIKGSKLIPGRHFPPSTVTRMVDANVVTLENEVPVNGSFRIYLFAGNPEKTTQAVNDFAAYLGADRSFYSVYKTPHNEGSPDSYFERHNPHSRFFTILVTFAANKNNIYMSKLPRLLQSYEYHIYADDQPDLRAPNAKAAAHEKLGFDPERGGVVVVRPDGHIACTVQLVEGSGTVDALNEYFAAFTSKPVGRDASPARL